MDLIQIQAPSGTPTQTAKTVDNVTSTALVAANLQRKYLIIQNQDGSNPVYLAFGAAPTALATNACLKVLPGGTYIAENGYIPTCAVAGLASTAPVAVQVLEG